MDRDAVGERLYLGEGCIVNSYGQPPFRHIMVDGGRVDVVIFSFVGIAFGRQFNVEIRNRNQPSSSETIPHHRHVQLRILRMAEIAYRQGQYRE